jgi:undecaprenyl-diphosphatase
VDFLNHYFQIVLLGIVEGVTEFLPISSTGHLLIAEHFLGTQEPDIFNVVIQAGAILAVVFIYWHKIIGLLGNLDRPEARAYVLKVLLAFAVTTVLILLLTVKLKLKLPESLTPVAWATLIGGLIIFAIEYLAKNLYPHEDVSWFEAVLVGAGQVVAAIFPGASRSGSTIMAGLAVGMKRPSVTEFSFLVGIPTMFAASAYATLKDRKDLHGVGHQLIIDTALGFVVSMIVAFFVVKWLLRFVQSHTFNGFAIYRVILGGALLIGLYTHAIPDVSNEEPKPAVAPVTTSLTTPLIAPVETNADSGNGASGTNTTGLVALPTTNAETAPVVPASRATNAAP